MTQNTHLAKGNDLILHVFWQLEHLFPFFDAKVGDNLGRVYPFCGNLVPYNWAPALFTFYFFILAQLGFSASFWIPSAADVECQ